MRQTRAVPLHDRSARVLRLSGWVFDACIDGARYPPISSFTLPTPAVTAMRKVRAAFPQASLT